MTATIAERLAAGIIATDAATATRPAGPCAECQKAILAGDRFARLLSGKLAHVSCTGRLGRHSRRAAR
jgi:hypothetical protein